MELPRVVYAIKHNKTNKVYIGSTASPERRFRAHLSNLKNGTHSVEDFQADFDRFGADLSFVILDEIKTHDERTKEKEYMEKYESFDRSKGYNYKDRMHITRSRTISKANLIKLVRSLNQSQVEYAFTLLSKLFYKEEEEE